MRSLWQKPAPFLTRLEGFFRRKTLHAFAEEIPDLDLLEPALRDRLLNGLEDGEKPVLILFAPSQSVLAAEEGSSSSFLLPWEITPTRALALTHQRLLVASRPYQTDDASSAVSAVDLQKVPLEEILSLEMGFVLLNAWFEVAWAQAGQPARLRVHFNAVSRDFFEDLCARMREGIRLLDSAIPHSQVGQGFLADLPYKFQSLIPHHLLLPGECIQAVVFRPAIWERRRLFPVRRTAPRLALVRTDASLILAHEALSQTENDHSWVGQMLPRRAICSAVLRGEPPREELILSLGPDSLSFLLGDADRAQLLEVVRPWI